MNVDDVADVATFQFSLVVTLFENVQSHQE